jgi:CheY-like chemotaxis protein
MNDGDKEMVHRILVIDDNPDIHKDFQTILLDENQSAELETLRAEVFGDNTGESTHRSRYELNFASQGKEGSKKIKQALCEKRPYELAFVDSRMPPGWDGLETIEHIWNIDPHIQIVFCTAYSDHSWEEITKRLGRSENLLILKKPFDSTEVAQLASALIQKWLLARRASMKMEQLEQMANERTDQLTKANELLEQEIAERKRAQERQAELLKQIESINLELRDFASIVSHDLKAPLRGIKTLANWISTDYADKLDEDGREQMNLLSGRVDWMYQLIEEVLEYSRVGRIKEEWVQMNLNEVVQKVIDVVAPPENIAITVENELPTIEYEPTRIAQVFQNLLSNAVKWDRRETFRKDFSNFPDTITTSRVRKHRRWPYHNKENRGIIWRQNLGRIKSWRRKHILLYTAEVKKGN